MCTLYKHFPHQSKGYFFKRMAFKLTTQRERERGRERVSDKLLNEYTGRKITLKAERGRQFFSTYKAKYCHCAHICVNIKRTPRDLITQIVNQKQFIT